MMWHKIFYCFSFLSLSLSQCFNQCNQHGLCSIYSRCDCFHGYEGIDCSRRSCPKGKAYTDISIDIDEGHKEIECSGKGKCNYLIGECQCDQGTRGISCSQSVCFNDCTGHGQCINLQQASEIYDGWTLNHTTTYNLWDSQISYGCQCDSGWSGHDCSIRMCEYGPDPRSGSSLIESVTLKCVTTSSSYSGKFKFRSNGYLMRSYLNTSSTVADLQRELMKLNPEDFNVFPTVYTPITVSSDNSHGLICSSSTTVTTTIKYHLKRRLTRGSILTISPQKLKHTSLFFQTTQYLSCDCTASTCGGSFHLVYEGELSSRINLFDPGSRIYSSLATMKTLASQMIIQNHTMSSSVGTTDSSSTICSAGTLRNHTIVLTGPMGNLPSFTLLADTVEDISSLSLSSTPLVSPDNTSLPVSRVLSLFTHNGRDEGIKVCNGLGRCDEDTGKCHCQYGWEFDPLVGQCGRPTTNTSDWAGFGRCPGVISRKTKNDWSKVRNKERLYLSINPVKGDWSTPSEVMVSMIYRYDWVDTRRVENMRYWPEGLHRYARIDTQTRTTIINMTTDESAGPILLDRAKDQLIYVDNNPSSPFIGIVSLIANSSVYPSSTWLSLTGQVFGFAFDAHFLRRKIYWTIPGTFAGANGQLYYASIDSVPATAHSLTATIGQSYLVQPMGLAIHYYQSRLYWVDTHISDGYQKTVVRSCKLDGSDVKQAYLYGQRDVGKVPIEANATDIILNLRNNSLYFFSSASPKGLVETSLDQLKFLDQATSPNNRDYYNVSVLHTTPWINITSPTYLFTDDTREMLLWTDKTQRTIQWMDMSKKFLYNTSSGVVHDYHTLFHLPVYTDLGFDEQKDTPIGLVIDKGMNEPEWGQYLDCHGNGRCKGLSGNWECECYDGFYGDCSMRSCPTGPAWFSEPYVENVSHDLEVECSNAGKCNRMTGACECDPGYEGSACQRSSCSRDESSQPCNGNGRCMSMRSLAATEDLVYGSNHHDPLTWDADMRYGCISDDVGYAISTPSASPSSSLTSIHLIPSYTFSDLSERLCPYGYDDRAQDTPPVREIQTLSCRASSGNFFLSFRGQITSSISVSTTLSELKTMLKSLGIIGDLTVTSAIGDTQVCGSSSSSQISIEFLTELGDLPLLVVLDHGTLAIAQPNSVSILVTETRKGTGRYLECSGRGICNRKTGECMCMKGRGSSDGMGNEGTRGDCGYESQ